MNVPVALGVNVIVFVQVAPAGTISPDTTKPETPWVMLSASQGAPSPKLDMVDPPAGNGSVKAPSLTAVVPVLESVNVKSTGAPAVTDVALSDVDSEDVPSAGGVVVPPPPPHPARTNTAHAITSF